MAEIPIDLPNTEPEVTFRATDGLPVRLSDSFLVGRAPDMFYLNFYQQDVGEVRGGIRDYKFEDPKATCFARIAL